ncbi:hypothetical protein H0N96_00485 [Candidatus Micrarchaeota archaeon]|nr:hypothetical protein [Candidatus Micrarchaeota archaeon]
MAHLREVVETVWEKAPDGESEFRDYHVVKDKKMVVLRPFDLTLLHRTHIVAFPRPKHFKEFRNASQYVLGEGPAESNPAAVGTVELELFNLNDAQLAKARVLKQIPKLKGKAAINLSYIQAHFKTGYYLPRKLATEYNGWRIRCLKEAILVAKKTRRVLVAEKSKFSTHCLEDLKKAAAFHSTKFIESENFVAIVPRIRK